MKAINMLVVEHDHILKMIAVTRQLLANKATLNIDHVEQIVDFIKNFADKYHHLKEEDVLFYLGSFGASGTKHFDAWVWNPNTEHYDKIEEFKDIPNPKISDKYKCILSRVYVSSAENEYAKYVCTNGHLIKVAELRQYWKGNIYPERDRAVYEEHFIKANVWKRNLKLNQISDFWKPVVPF